MKIQFPPTASLPLIALTACTLEPMGDARTMEDHDEPTGEVAQPLSINKLAMTAAIVTDPDGPGLAESRQWYLDRLSSSVYPNVKKYVQAISGNRFTPSLTPITYLFEDIPTAEYDESAGVVDSDSDTVKILKRTRQQMIDNDYPFDDYDLDSDGRVDEDELVVFVISDYWDGAVTRSLGCRRDSEGTNVCMRFMAIGHEVGMQNYAHEFLHMLGAVDIYNYNDDGTDCLSEYMSLMSCTIETAQKTYYPDPWHRRFFGWVSIAGELYPTASTGTFKLRPVSNDVTGPSGVQTIQAIKRSTSGQGEKLVFEYRKRDTTYDRDTAKQGVIAWYQETNSSGNLRSITSLRYPDDTDKTHFTLKPISCIGDPMNIDSRGEAGELKPGNWYRFKWRDGNDTGLRFSAAAPASDNSVTVTWQRNSTAASCPNG